MKAAPLGLKRFARTFDVGKLLRIVHACAERIARIARATAAIRCNPRREFVQHDACGEVETEWGASLQRQRDAMAQARDSRRARIRRKAGKRRSGRALG
ncbi:hypothetical protein [Burkholderia sp. Bp9031]|uniref:hypothetical protein n=1 Tax=Burkholderia sp. Bp9031 TaxID=2184566 RepID=UPI001639BEA5|nr:hypothetical protein [Burkholderia sp. Bp9031]